MRFPPPADTRLFPIDGNDTYGDCVVAATAHLFYLLFGVVIPLDTVLKDFKGWCSSGGCMTGVFVWFLWWNGMHGHRIKQFCRIAGQADVDWAIATFGGCIIRIFSGAHQATIIGKLPNGLYRVVVWGQDGWIKDLSWTDIAGTGENQLALDRGGHFAMSTSIKPVMLWYSLKNNWVLDFAIFATLALGLHYGGVI